MALTEDLEQEVKKIFATNWTEEDTNTIPEPEDLLLNSNHAKKLICAVLYADLDGSTNMVDTLSWSKAAEIYKSYLRCASMIIRAEGGTITAYDGDRVMALYVGKTPLTDAVRTAMKINRAVVNIIRPAYKAQYSDSSFEVKHNVGIDSSVLRAARVGVRGDNDIVWVGRAANYAAKLTALTAKPLWITETVYKNMADATKYIGSKPETGDMWTKYTWNTFNNSAIYGSNFMWSSI